MMAATAQQEHKFSENEEVFFVLKNATMCSAMSPIPNSFYIRGRVHNGQFVPESTVLGEGEFEVIGQNGWLEIKIGKFYPAHTAQAPISPYVEGHMTDYGFVPSRREIK